MLKAIVAHDPNRVIGNNLDIPWHIKEDFLHFKETTTGHTIVYGSKTFTSMGKALPNRKNIVLIFPDSLERYLSE
jgi:dihydrofolate reductase